MKVVFDLLGLASVLHLAYSFEYFLLFRISKTQTVGKCRNSSAVSTSCSFMNFVIPINIPE